MQACTIDHVWNLARVHLGEKTSQHPPRIKFHFRHIRLHAVQRPGDELRRIIVSMYIALLGTTRRFLVISPDTTNPILRPTALVSHSQDE